MSTLWLLINVSFASCSPSLWLSWVIRLLFIYFVPFSVLASSDDQSQNLGEE